MIVVINIGGIFSNIIINWMATFEMNETFDSRMHEADVKYDKIGY